MKLTQSQLPTFCLLTLGALAAVLTPPGARAQTLYEADNGSGDIYAFNSSGQQSTFASGLTPGSMAFDSSGNLFVTEQSAGTIVKISPGGAVTTFATGLNLPGEIAFDSAGNLYEADSGSNNIYRFTPTGTQTLVATAPSPANGVPANPDGLAFNSAGTLFFDEYADGAIYEVTSPGNVTLFAQDGNGSFSRTTGMAFDRFGNLFVENPGYNSLSPGIDVLSPTGQQINHYNFGNLSGGLAFDQAGNLFESNGNGTNSGPSNSIDEITPGGTITQFAGGLDNPEGLVFVVPEPSTWAMLGLGAAGLCLTLRRQHLCRRAH
jgi:sugar lactone lactonase YvrE